MKCMLFFSVALLLSAVSALETPDIQKCDPQQCDAQLTQACDNYIREGYDKATMCAIELQGQIEGDGCLYDDQPCDPTKKSDCDSLLATNPAMLACLNHQTIGSICRRKA